VNPKISVVIPMLNETSNLEPLLEALMNQTYQPDDIIFVDAGSTDGSPLLVVDWWKSNGSKAGACHVISRQGAFPGGARNFGIRTASSDWIAFLDCGIVPDENWLAALVQCADDGKAKAVFGVCRFVPKEDRMSQALCALSYGEGKLWNVLPASIVHRSVFESIGGFREELRSAEDIEWFKRFERRYGPRFTCKQAIVTYSNFPATLRKAVVKWFVYARNTVRAGVWIRHQLIVCAVWFMVIGVSFINWGTALVVLFAYTATRGVLTPLYRNGVRQVLGRPSTLLLTYLVGFVLDLAKLSGFLTEYLYKLKEIFFSSKGSRHHPSSV
jgi:glycosyltransferase involved in cell wall biosynthesis